MSKSSFKGVEQPSNQTTPMPIILKEIMAELHLSARDVASKTGIAHQQLSRYINGQKPNKTTLQRIADGLGIDIERLCPPDGTQIFVCPHCGHRYVIHEVRDQSKKNVGK